jgi:hypothetical protein
MMGSFGKIGALGLGLRLTLLPVCFFLMRLDFVCNLLFHLSWGILLEDGPGVVLYSRLGYFESVDVQIV